MVIISIIYKCTIKGQIKQVIQKDIEEQWTQYRALWDSPIDRGPVTARAHNFNPKSLANKRPWGIQSNALERSMPIVPTLWLCT